MDSTRYKEEWATKAFKEAVTKKRRDNVGVGEAKVQSFKDKKAAYAVYKANTKRMDRMSFTKTSIEKLWKAEMKKSKKLLLIVEDLYKMLLFFGIIYI